MAIPASEHCNPCDNAAFVGRRHVHQRPDRCDRPLYGGDFFCACTQAGALIRPARHSGPLPGAGTPPSALLP
jgi:hypothetical protein